MNRFFRASLATMAFMTCSVSAQVVIDPLTDAATVGPMPLSGSIAQDLGSVIGGERDLESVGGFNTCTIASGELNVAGNTAFNGCVLDYDGNDNDAVNPTIPGLYSTDITDMGNEDVLEIVGTLTAGTCNLRIQICDSSAAPTNCHAEQQFITTTTLTFPLSDYSNAGIDLTDVSFIQLNIAPQSVPVDCTIGALATTPVTLQHFEIID